MYEFLELGIPAIVTRLRSAAAYFSDEAIFFVEPDNPHDMAKALVTLAQDPARGERMAAAGLREVAQYSWSQEAKRYVAAIEGVVAKS
jgi:glycosyltransferase involved in cell wall biosynthesis